MIKALLFLSLFAVMSLACSVTIDITPNAEVPTAETTPVLFEPATTTPEVFIARTQAIPAQVQLNGVTLAVQEAYLGACDLPNCPPAPTGTHYLRVILQALNLPADQFVDYKNLPQGIAIHDETGIVTPFNRVAAYAPNEQRLTLYFTVPQAAQVFGLQWPNVAEIPLTIAAIETLTAPSFEGTAVTYAPLRLVIPFSVASGASGSDMPRLDSDDAAWWQKTPGHLEVSLADYYTLQGKAIQPTIYVYPAQAYGELLPVAFENIHRLNNTLYDPSAPIGEGQLPVAPTFNAAQLFASNIQVLSFQNGSGVRSITQYDQYAAPVNNTELFYHFQGVTRDGMYYIVAAFPITAPVLAETNKAEAVVPTGGIAYPTLGDPKSDFPAYYAAVANVLNAAPADAFAPTLNQLDLLIQSMQITP